MATLKHNWNNLRDGLEGTLRSGLGELVEGGIESLDGPIRDTANRLTVAIRRGRQDLADEARDALTVAMLEQEIKAKATMAPALDIFLTGGINLLVNGAISALAAVVVAP